MEEAPFFAEGLEEDGGSVQVLVDGLSLEEPSDHCFHGLDGLSGLLLKEMAFLIASSQRTWLIFCAAFRMRSEEAGP